MIRLVAGGLLGAPLEIGGLGPPVVINDEMQLTDAATVKSGSPIVIAEAMSFVDAVQVDSGSPVNIIDQMSLDDVMPMQSGSPIVIADSIGLSDTAAIASGSPIVISDQLGLVDNMALSSGAAIVINDSLGLSDYMAIANGVAAVINDTLSLSDNMTVISELLDPHKTVMSQYVGESPRINAIINSAFEAWGVNWDFDQFLTNAWDIDTAEGYWLDCWGIIVGFGREVVVPSTNILDPFGFNQAGLKPFNQAPFSRSSIQQTEVVTLDDTTYRRLIKLKARANFGNGSPAFINKQLHDLFNPDGALVYRKSFIIKTGTMSAYYIFDFIPEPWELSVVMNTQIIPKPAGVWFGYADSTRWDRFGFNQAGLKPFNQAPFSTF